MPASQAAPFRAFLLQAAPPQQQAPPPVTEEQVKQVKEMFPTFDDAVIRSVLESKNGNMEAAITDLIEMQ